MRIILASQSPFRKHALDILGLSYEVLPSHIDESAIRHKDPAELAQRLSRAKALRIGEENPDSIVVSADLFVVHDHRIIEKPRDEGHAKDMLKAFSGNVFDIVTGLSVYNSATRNMLSAAEVCTVRFRTLTDFEIDDYVARYPAVQCAGAFEADGMLRFAEHVEGNYNFRTALPVNKLIVFLRENGVRV